MPKTPYFKKEIVIPENVDVSIENNIVTVKGPKGTLTKDLSHMDVKLRKEDNKVIADGYFVSRKLKAQIGTAIAHVRNMIKGVTEGFVYKMKIIYSHFPFTVEVKDNLVYIKNFLGERAPRVAKIVGSVKVSVEEEDVIIEGIDIEEVGQTAANIQHATKIKNKDPRAFSDGIYVYVKGGKQLVKAA
ncbi:MAG: 50S ribosomal protein L6 [Candidatus Asgardarchaeia archaeon]